MPTRHREPTRAERRRSFRDVERAAEQGTETESADRPTHSSFREAEQAAEKAAADRAAQEKAAAADSQEELRTAIRDNDPGKINDALDRIRNERAAKTADAQDNGGDDSGGNGGGNDGGRDDSDRIDPKPPEIPPAPVVAYGKSPPPGNSDGGNGGGFSKLQVPENYARPNGTNPDASTENYIAGLQYLTSELANPNNHTYERLLEEIQSASSLADSAERRGNADQARRLREFAANADRWLEDNRETYLALWSGGNEPGRRVERAISRHQQGYAAREERRQQAQVLDENNAWLTEFLPRFDKVVADGFTAADKGSLAGEIEHHARQLRDAGLVQAADALDSWAGNVRSADLTEPWNPGPSSDGADGGPSLWDADPDANPAYRPGDGFGYLGSYSLADLLNLAGVTSPGLLQVKGKNLYVNAVARSQAADQLWEQLNMDALLRSIDNAYATGDIASGNAAVALYNENLKEYLPVQQAAADAVQEYQKFVPLIQQVGRVVARDHQPELRFGMSPQETAAKFGDVVPDKDGNPVPAVRYAGLHPLTVNPNDPGAAASESLVSSTALKIVNDLMNRPDSSNEIRGLPHEYRGKTAEEIAGIAGFADSAALTQKGSSISAQIQQTAQAAAAAEASGDLAASNRLATLAWQMWQENENLLAATHRVAQLDYQTAVNQAHQEHRDQRGLLQLERQYFKTADIPFGDGRPDPHTLVDLRGVSIDKAFELAGVRPTGNLNTDLGHLELAIKRVQDGLSYNYENGIYDPTVIDEANRLYYIANYIVGRRNQEVRALQQARAEAAALASPVDGFPTALPQSAPYPATDPEVIKHLSKRLELWESWGGSPGQSDDLVQFLKDNPEITTADFAKAAEMAGNRSSSAWNVAREHLAPAPDVPSIYASPQPVEYPVDRKPGFSESPVSAAGQLIERLWEGSPAYWSQERRDQFLVDNPELAKRAEDLKPLIDAIEADRHNQGQSYFLKSKPYLDYSAFAVANPGASREDFYQHLAGSNINAVTEGTGPYLDPEPYWRVQRYLADNPGVTRDDLVFAAAMAGLPFFTDGGQANAQIQSHFLHNLRGIRGNWQWNDNPMDYFHRFDYATNLLGEFGDGLAHGAISPTTLDLVNLTNPWHLSAQAHTQNKVDEAFLTAATIPLGAGAGSVILRGGALGAKYLAPQALRPILIRPAVQNVGRFTGRTAGDTFANLLDEALPSHSYNRRWFDYTRGDLLKSLGFAAGPRIVMPGLRAGGRFAAQAPYRAGLMLEQMAITGGRPTTTRQRLDDIYDIMQQTPGGTVAYDFPSIERALARLERDSQAVGLPAQPGFVNAITTRRINIPGLMADKQAAMLAGTKLGGGQQFLGPETGVVIRTKSSPLNDYLVKTYGTEGIGFSGAPTIQDWAKPGAVVNEGRMYNTFAGGSDRFMPYDAHGRGGYGRGGYANPAPRLHQSMHPFNSLMETDEWVRLTGDQLNPGQSIPIRWDWKPVGNLPLLRRPYLWRAIFDQETLPPGGLSRADIRAINRAARALRSSDRPGVWIEAPEAAGSPLPLTPAQALLRARNLTQDNADLAVAPLPLLAAGEGDYDYLPPAMAAALGLGIAGRYWRFRRGLNRPPVRAVSNYALDHKPNRALGVVINKEHAYSLLNPAVRLWSDPGDTPPEIAGRPGRKERATSADSLRVAPPAEPMTPPPSETRAKPPATGSPSPPPRIPPPPETGSPPPSEPMTPSPETRLPPPETGEPPLPPRIPPPPEPRVPPPPSRIPPPPETMMPPPPGVVTPERRAIPPMPEPRVSARQQRALPPMPQPRVSLTERRAIPPMPEPRTPPRPEPRTPPPRVPPPPPPPRPEPRRTVSGSDGEAERTFNPGAYPAAVEWTGVTKHTLDLNTGEYDSVPLTGDNLASARVVRHQPEPTPEARHRAANLDLHVQGGSVGLRSVSRRRRSSRRGKRGKREKDIQERVEVPRIRYVEVE